MLGKIYLHLKQSVPDVTGQIALLSSWLRET